MRELLGGGGALLSHKTADCVVDAGRRSPSKRCKHFSCRGLPLLTLVGKALWKGCVVWATKKTRTTSTELCVLPQKGYRCVSRQRHRHTGHASWVASSAANGLGGKCRRVPGNKESVIEVAARPPVSSNVHTRTCPPRRYKRSSATCARRRLHKGGRAPTRRGTRKTTTRHVGSGAARRPQRSVAAARRIKRERIGREDGHWSELAPGNHRRCTGPPVPRRAF